MSILLAINKQNVVRRKKHFFQACENIVQNIYKLKLRLICNNLLSIIHQRIAAIFNNS